MNNKNFQMITAGVPITTILQQQQSKNVSLDGGRIIDNFVIVYDVGT